MRWVWSGWLVFLVLSFAVFEAWALAHHQLTLSQYTYDLSKAWPLLPFVAGMLSGGLAVHFWWHWLPAGSSGDRG